MTNPRATARSLPLVRYRRRGAEGSGSVIRTQDLDPNDNNPTLWATTALPPFVEFSLRALGWLNEEIKVVEVAASVSSEASEDNFILTLAEQAGIPLAEGHFVWQLLQREQWLSEM
ncbi:hypothetical protein NMY22_g4313 [Coprinellus aureogranulatus]|nr:hypothetical protein NMY22_g4313 [Coprinellus aureogranulatus]